MAPRHDSPRRRPSASLVISLLALFIALGSGAYAASKIGTKQLKNKAVTTKKLDNKAVSGKKLASKAVSAKKLGAKSVKTSKLAPGAVTGSKIDDESTPFGRVVHMATGDSETALPSGSLVSYPLDGATYTQKAGQSNSFAAGAEVRFDAGCTQPRTVVAYLLVDPSDPLNPDISEIFGYSSYTDTGTGTVTRRINFGPSPSGGRPLFRSDQDTPRHLYLVAAQGCTAGAGVSMTFGGVDVMATVG
jgi:hypothetical protein